MCVTDGCACNSPQFSAARPAHDTGAGSDHRPDSRGRAACRQFLGYRLAFPGSLRRAGTLVCLGGCGDLPSGAGALLGEFFFHGHAGASPLLLWAGWKLEPSVLVRCAPILCWAAALAGLLCLLGLNGQFHWESLMMQADAQTIILPLYPEYFALPLFCPAKQVRALSGFR